MRAAAALVALILAAGAAMATGAEPPSTTPGNSGATPNVAPVSAASTAAPISSSPAHAASANTVSGYSAAALYDLANAYVRAGKTGLAVLSYERARLLDPGDPDLDANLRHVRAVAGLPDEARSRFERYGSSVDSTLFFWIGVGGVALAGAATLARRRHRNRRTSLGWLRALGVVAIAAAACNAAALWPVMSRAIVIAHTAPVHVSPVSIGDPVFSIPEAQDVRVRAERQGFALVETAEGRVGWVAAGDVARVVPRASK